MKRLLLAAFLLAAGPAFAQSPPTGAAELFGGYAGFVDEGWIDHGVIGGSTRIYMSPRVSIGPELVYMRGPGGDRDLFLTGNLTFDLRTPAQRVVPFLVAGGGIFRHTQRFGASDFSSWEGAVTGGGGVRVRLTERVYSAAEFRAGWEPHIRLTGGIGVNW